MLAAITPTYKWVYRNLAKLPRSQPIPAGANAEVVRGLEGFHSREFLALMDKAREMRLFGMVSIIDAEGRVWAEVEMHNGVAVKVYRTTHAIEGQGNIKPARPYRIQLRQSDMNPLVTMKKPEEIQ